MKKVSGGSFIETNEAFEQFLRNPDLIHLIGMTTPWYMGVHECFAKFEHVYFTPGTPKNENFHLRILVWMKAIWTVISVPADALCRIEEISEECGLQVVKGVPSVILEDKIECLFLPPLENRVFTLLYKPDNLVYKNDAALVASMFKAEQEAIKRIIEHHRETKRT